MDSEEMVFRLRKRIFEEWRWKRYTWQEVREKYGFSKKWFYKWLPKFLKYGGEGLRNKVRKKPLMPHALSWNQKLRIMDYVYEHPTHGPNRIAGEQVPRLAGSTVWEYLVKENLNTRKRRRLWAHAQGKPVLTEKEKLQMQAKKNHIESKYPGELVSMDTFTVSVKGLGKIWQFTACDTYSSYGWAKCYHAKTSDNAADFLVNHMLVNMPAFKVKRVLTDQGVEFYSARHKDCDSYFTRICKRCHIKHTVTKPAHPWTNGYAERLNQTIWQDFYLCLLSRPYASIEALSKDLNTFMTDYNFRRRHTGYKLKEGGYEFPGHAFFDVKENSNIIEIKY